MSYKYGYEIAALLFLAVISITYFRKRQLPSASNHLFAFVLIFGMADIFFDIVGAIIVDHISEAPAFLFQLVNTLFYSMQILFPLVMCIYILLLSELPKPKRTPYSLLLSVPSILCEILLITNPFTHVFFYIDPVNGYTHGAFYSALIGIACFYMFLAFLFINIFRNALRKAQYFSLLTLIILVFSAIVIQYFFPSYLLTGLAIALSVTLMFLTFQNPGDMLDPLTRVFHRGSLSIFAKIFLDEGKTFQLISVDLSNMRRINRLFGMSLGNEILFQVASFLRGKIPGDRHVFRFIGDHFVVITQKKQTYQKLLQDIEKRFREPFPIGETSTLLTATVCHTDDTSFITSPEMLVNLLEITIPEMKKRGKGTVQKIDASALQSLNRTSEVETALRNALDQDKLDIYFQPVYSRKAHCFTTAEVLVRLNDSEIGPISPGEFIPIAERNGLILRVDEAVLRKTCLFIQEYQPFTKLGLESLCVNLSAVEFFQDNLTEKLLGILAAREVSPNRITLEITETAVSSTFDSLRESMQKLSTSGFRFALDDYGTGYANITRLANLPFDSVKVDISILASHRESLRHAILFDDTVHMLQRLGYVTVVEGVENMEDASVVQRMNVDYIQGYHYAKPMPSLSFVSLLETQMSEK